MLCRCPPPSISALSMQSAAIPYLARKADSPSGREKGSENNSETGSEPARGGDPSDAHGRRAGLATPSRDSAQR
eukprot:4989689-Pleurochrysis_carterae.AAC.4